MRRLVRRVATSALGLAILLSAGASTRAQWTPTALAPMETILAGRTELVGVAVAPDGTRYVSDRGAGIVYRTDAQGVFTPLVTALDRPAGLAIDAAGRLLIAEEGAGRVRRLEANGVLSVAASGIKTPRWLALASDGAMYVSAHRVTGTDGPDTTEGRQIIRLAPDGALTVVATGIRRLEGLARVNGHLIAATKGLESGPDSAGMLLRYPVTADGSLGTPATWVGTGVKQPMGLAADVLHAVYVASKELLVEDDRTKRAIGKVHPDAHVTDVGASFTDPQGLALGPDGALYLADGRAGALLRFPAPPAPALSVPDVTSHTTLTATGTTQAGARLDLFVDEATTGVWTTADATGAFTLEVTLTADAVTALTAYATTHGGEGLTSAAAEASVRHDGVAPALTIDAPPAAAHVRATVTVAATATDAGSDVAMLSLTVDGQALGATLAPAPPAPAVTATASWDTTGIGDGVHTLGASATDRAGNAQSVSRTVVVDNTPPETTMTSGPDGDLGVTTATFTFAGADNLTPAESLVFAWRLDGGVWSAFTAATSVPLSNLSETTHVFEVVARDLAGNEDPTPAARTFTVRLGPSITTLDPTSGAVGTFVTLTGGGFEPGATTVAFNGTAAIVRTVTATAITTTVPVGATTGPLIVTTTRGTASRDFAVTRTRDFTFTAAPASVAVVPGTSASVALTVTGELADLLTLEHGALPAGVTATFVPPVATAVGGSVLTLTADSTTPTGGHPIEIRATARIDGTAVTRTASVTLDAQPPGQTLLVGHVRDRSDRPLAGVRILRGDTTLMTLGTSDAGGNLFIPLDGVPLAPDGSLVLLVDGSPLNTDTAFWPTVPLTVTITPGVVNTLGFVPKLEPIPGTKLIPIMPGQATVLTDAALPGFAMTIPAGVQIIGWDGQPNTQVGVVAVPLDRSPLPPPPAGVTATRVYLFSFGKMGGGLPTGTVTIDRANDLGALPGERVDLYYFNEAPDGSAPNRWEKYGTATASADGTRLITDVNPATGKRYGIPRFCCGSDLPVRPPTPSVGGGPSGGASDAGQLVGEPVDVATGFFYVTKTDMVLPGIIPIAITRTYRANLTNAGPFGLGTSWEWDIFLQPPPNGSPSALLLFTPGNRQDLFAQQSNGTFVNTTSPALRGAMVTVDGNGRTLRFKDGRAWRFDTAGRLSSQADRNGNTVTLTRDGQARVTAITEPRGRQLTITYEGTSLRIATVEDPLGRIVRYEYDGQGRLANVFDPLGGKTSYTYDAAHRMETLKDPRDIVFLENEYDAAGRVTRQEQADGGVWTFSYVATGSYISETTVTQPGGHSTRYRFNAAGYPESETDPLGQTTTFEREPGTNLVVATTDPLGRTTSFAYDAQGNVTMIADPTGTEQALSYHPVFSGLTSVTGPLGHGAGFEYDDRGNLTGVVDALGARTVIVNNQFGQPVSVSDPVGTTVVLAYDGMGNLASVTDAGGNVTRFAYDVASRQIEQTAPQGQTTRFRYDALNRLTTIIDALAAATHISYDGNGNVVTVTDPNGNRITHTHDSMDRLLSRSYPLGGTEEYSYGPSGALIRHADRSGRATTYDYDALNRRIAAAYADGTVTRFVHDGAGHAVEITDSLGGTILQEHDLLDRLVRQTTAAGTVRYEFDVLARRTATHVSGESPVSYEYDAASRLRRVQQQSRIVELEYDAAGRRTSLTLPNGVVTEYAYDASRLARLTYRNAAGTLGDLGFVYDAVGNITGVSGSFAQTLMPDPVSSSLYDAENRQLSFGDKTLTYDASGNLTTVAEPDAVTTLTWDARNRLLDMEGAGVTASFRYDAFGRRIGKTINGMTTEYLYDGPDIAQEVRDGFAVGYLRLLHVDAPVARGAEEVYLSGLGSVIGLSDVNGALTTRYIYEPFGRTVVEGAASESALQFTARENDGTGLYYYRARYYAPALHRFTGQDLVLRPGANRYAYVSNNPLIGIDPFGLDTLVINGGPGSSGPGGSSAGADPVNDGLDGIARRLRREANEQILFFNSGDQRAIIAAARRIRAAGRPLYIVGHSLGAQRAVLAALDLLEIGITPDHVFTIDPFIEDGTTIPKGLPLTNFYQQRDWRIQGREIGGAQANVVVPGVDHFLITEHPTVQNTIVETVRAQNAVLGGRY